MPMDEVLPKTVRKRTVLVFALLAASFAASPSPAPSPARAEPTSTGSAGYLDPLPQDTGPSGLKQELRRLENTGRLMMVVAHPDDEDGGLLTLESRGKG